MAQAGGRGRRRGRHGGGGLNRQGGRRGARARQRHDCKDPGPARRDRSGGPGAGRTHDRPGSRGARPKRGARRGGSRRPSGGGGGRRRRHEGLAGGPQGRGRERSGRERRSRLRAGRQGDEGRRARGGERRAGCHRGAGAGRCAGRRGEALARPRGDARAGDEREPLGSHRHLLPDALRGRSRCQAQGAERRAQGARDEGLLHPFDRLGDRRGRSPVGRDGAGLRRERREAAGDRARRGESRDRGRRRAKGRLAQPDGPVHQGRRWPRVRGLPRLLRGPDQQDAREQADRRRLSGHEHHAHQPGRARDGRVGPAPVGRPGNDRRHRVDRLPGRVGPRARRQAEVARRLEGDDDDVDLRSPDHPGSRVRLVLAPHRRAAPGRGRFL